MKKYSAVTHHDADTGLHYVTIETGRRKGCRDVNELANRRSDAVIKILKNNDYFKMGQEHDRLVSTGETALKIAQWLGKELNLKRWNDGEFYGRLNALSSPTTEETERLGGFLTYGKKYSQQWARGSGASDFVPQMILLDGYISTRLFGHQNLFKVNEKMKEIAEVWEGLGRKYKQKEKYLKEHLGLEIQGRWDCLPGMRNASGRIYHKSNKLVHIVGSRTTPFDSMTLTLGKTHGELRSQTFTSEAGLCLLLGK